MQDFYLLCCEFVKFVCIFYSSQNLLKGVRMRFDDRVEFAKITPVCVKKSVLVVEWCYLEGKVIGATMLFRNGA